MHATNGFPFILYLCFIKRQNGKFIKYASENEKCARNAIKLLYSKINLLFYARLALTNT